MAYSFDEIQALPKSLLHDHLDGGLRPATILEISEEIGHQLPSSDLDDLAAWFVSGANTKDLLQYLAIFEHTIAVMQTREHLHRVAREAALDLAADGVAYAEVRFAPENHQLRGLSLDAVMEAVQDGFRAGTAEAAASGKPTIVNTIVCAMRQAERSVEIARLAVEWNKRDPRVVAFDLAGPETGFPPTDHLEAMDVVRRSHLHLTLHASEQPGLELISQALYCGAERIGHGVRLCDDMTWDGDRIVGLGHLARYVLERQIPLEMAPSCHVHVGAVDSFEQHPLVAFHRHGFKVTVNTDNRLMSGVSVSSETHELAHTFGLTRTELCELAVAGVESSFCEWSERRRLVDHVIRPAYEV